MIVAELVGATICLLALIVGVGALWIYRPDRAADLQRVSDDARGLVRAWTEESGKRIGALETEVARLTSLTASRPTAPAPPADGSTMLPPKPPPQPAPSTPPLPSLLDLHGDDGPPSHRGRTLIARLVAAPPGAGNRVTE